MVLLVPITAQADERLGVVVRQGAHDATIVQRLRGQLADLNNVTLTLDANEIEPTLDGQLTAAERLGAEHDARVVVWFVTRGKKLEVAVATPRDHRLFVREIPAAGESSMAEAAAIAVRSAIRSIALGGTIGIEIKPTPEREPEPPPEPVVEKPVPPPPPHAASTSIEASLGWQVALDGGAANGAHALVQRTTIARDTWAASLSLSLGVPLEWRAANDVSLDVSRSGALLGGELRFGSLAFGLGAGALLYHRSTSTAPTGLTATPSNSTIAFAGALEGAWRAQLSDRIRFVVMIGVDAVAGAPAAAVSRNGMVEVVDTIGPLQPRASLALEVGSW
jgi:hypothetical protein